MSLPLFSGSARSPAPASFELSLRTWETAGAHVNPTTKLATKGGMAHAIRQGDFAGSTALPMAAGIRRPDRAAAIPRAYLVYMGFDGETGLGGGAGDIANVSHVLKPSARRSASNSQ